MSLLADDQTYQVHLGDCIPHMASMPAASVDMSVFSPPFPALYAYTSEEADIGNSDDLNHEMKLHLGFFYRQLARVLKPGRVAMVHVMQIPRMKRSGGVGLCDFRGLNIRIGERAGLVYEYDWSVRKNPQSQAIRTKSRELQFSGLESDRAKSRGALPDYLIKFRAPGENAVRIQSKGDVSRSEWIELAECTWMDIRETDTLNVREGRGEDDIKHICPLQLPVIDRLVRLYSNPGEIVFSPFTGIGSEGYKAVQLGRRFYGCELKPEYHAAALRNLARASERGSNQISMFADAEAAEAVA
jgi:DNA modification methylase